MVLLQQLSDKRSQWLKMKQVMTTAPSRRFQISRSIPAGRQEIQLAKNSQQLPSPQHLQSQPPPQAEGLKQRTMKQALMQLAHTRERAAEQQSYLLRS